MMKATLPAFVVRFTFRHDVEEVRIKDNMAVPRPVTRCFIETPFRTYEGKVSLFHKDKNNREKARKLALERAIGKGEDAKFNKEERRIIWKAYFDRLPPKAPKGRRA